MSRRVALLLITVLNGCSGHPITRPDIQSGSTASTVLVYRESAFNSSAATLYFGENGATYLALNNNQYGEIRIAPGSHHFVAAATASQDFILGTTLLPGTKTCIKAYADPANYAKVLIPVLMNLTNIFTMEVVSCPSEEIIKNYAKVP